VITPTIGRIVWWFPHADEMIMNDGVQPLAAIIVHVTNDRVVNLAVHDRWGYIQARTEVPLLQDDDVAPTEHGYATWMPYQLANAPAPSPAPAPEPQE